MAARDREKTKKLKSDYLELKKKNYGGFVNLDKGKWYFVTKNVKK